MRLQKHWAEQFEGLLRLSKKEILTHAGSISAKIAETHALNEFEKKHEEYWDARSSDISEKTSGNNVLYIQNMMQQWNILQF